MGRMRTPEEAKELHCPFMRPQLTTRYQENCIANKCMAWQWGKAYTTTISDIGPHDHKTGNKGKGYCSLTSVKD